MTTQQQRINKVKEITSNITMEVFGTVFTVLVGNDHLYGRMDFEHTGPPETTYRIYLQVQFSSPCTKTGELTEWKGRKWYLSDYMTDDEIVKTSYCAFKAAVEHEVMEGFKINNIIVFNPHVDYKALMSISHQEIKRD